jgi:hypothetical protein
LTFTGDSARPEHRLRLGQVDRATLSDHAAIEAVFEA